MNQVVLNHNGNQNILKRWYCLSKLRRKDRWQIKVKVCVFCCRDGANGGQRILDNLPPPAADSSTTLKHAAASCKRADYDWTTQIIGLIFGPLCNRVLGESLCVFWCAYMCVACIFFFLWTKMITQRRKCSIYRMSHIEWPGNFPRTDGRILSSCAKLCLKTPACMKMNLDPSNFKMCISLKKKKFSSAYFTICKCAEDFTVI